MPTPLTDAIEALTRYANETTGQSDTTLSDAVETLVDGYGGGGGTNVLTHNWDFTQSLTDTVGGVVATIANCTQSSSGLYFGASNSKLSFPNKMLKANSRIEIDIASYDRQGTNHGRLFMVSDEQGLVYRSTGYWGLYRNYGSGSAGWYMTTISDPAYFDGHTLKLIIDEYGTINFYRDDEFIIAGLAMLIDGSFTIGSSSNATYYLTITGMRVYENQSALGKLKLVDAVVVLADARTFDLDLTPYQNYDLMYVVEDVTLSSSDWLYYVGNGSSPSGGTYSNGSYTNHKGMIYGKVVMSPNEYKYGRFFISNVASHVQAVGSNYNNIFIYTYSASKTIKAGSVFKIYAGNYSEL